MAIDPNYSSTSSYSSSDLENNYKLYSVKKGVGFGAFGGFISILVFTGIILFIPIILNYPVGTFFIALGEMVFGFNQFDVSIITGITGFSLILLQGIILGMIFGLVISSITKLHPTNKKRGIIQGLSMGIISFIIIGIPLVYLIVNNLNQVLITYPESLLSIKGLSGYAITATSDFPLLLTTFSIFFIGYIFYGILLGGIVTLAYSVYNYSLHNIKEKNTQ